MLPAARGISRSVSQQHRSAPARCTSHGDPDQHVFIGYRAHGLTDGRKRAPPLCANPRRTTGPRGQTIGTRPRHSPARPRRPPVTIPPPPPAVPTVRRFPSRPARARTSSSPYRSTVVIVLVVVVVVVIPRVSTPVFRRSRPPVVNTCSVCQHAVYVASASVG